MSSQLKTGKRSVLIVEDNDINREMLSAILEDEFEVIEAENGLVGLQKLEEHYEDLSLVLLDVMMPVCNGLEFLRRKNEDPRFDSVPVIVTTASVGRDDEIKCLELGANDFVAKPYDVEIMMNRINNTVHLRESASIVNQLMWDDLTGLYSKEFFYRRVDGIFVEYPGADFDMVCTDIENFKSLNDRYGRQNCDQLL
ncbi:MAG: response regulator, partial [Coriobacteriales bacterium]|nr:response regulator [Coriobacteriales bacterium]